MAIVVNDPKKYYQFGEATPFVDYYKTPLFIGDEVVNATANDCLRTVQIHYYTPVRFNGGYYGSASIVHKDNDATKARRLIAYNREFESNPEQFKRRALASKGNTRSYVLVLSRGVIDYQNTENLTSDDIYVYKTTIRYTDSSDLSNKMQTLIKTTLSMERLGYMTETHILTAGRYYGNVVKNGVTQKFLNPTLSIIPDEVLIPFKQYVSAVGSITCDIYNLDKINPKLKRNSKVSYNDL